MMTGKYPGLPDRQQAFSLVNLIIIIAIAVILGSVITTGYRQYTIKSRIAGALPELSGLQNEIAASLVQTGRYPNSGGPVAFNSSVFRQITVMQSIYHPATSGQGNALVASFKPGENKQSTSRLLALKASDDSAASPEAELQTDNPISGSSTPGSASNPFGGNGRTRVIIIAEINPSAVSGIGGSNAQIRLEANTQNPGFITWICGYPADMPASMIPLEYMPDNCQEPISLSGR